MIFLRLCERVQFSVEAIIKTRFSISMRGSFMAARTCWQQYSLSDPALAEAISMCEALSWIKSMEMHAVIVV